MKNSSEQPERMTIGIDLGDKFSSLCVLDGGGEVNEEGRVQTTQAAFRRRFEHTQRARIAIETGTHSPWVNELLTSLGHEVIVANAREVASISQSHRKTDRRDAEQLARMARADVKLLHPIDHRSKEGREHLLVLRSRSALVEARTGLVNHVRGVAKSAGLRMKKCSATSFHKQELPSELREILGPIQSTISALTTQIRDFDRRIEGLCHGAHPETNVLRQVKGVGPLTGLCFVLTIGDPRRFKRGRIVGAYVGLAPGRKQSGDSDPELGISKAGDRMLRTLLVQSAHYILGPFGPDTDLRRFGKRLEARGGKSAKKRAVVAVARKLAVLLHALWRTGEVYEPLRHSARSSTPATMAG